ncbi:MAG: energy transducer TonB [Sphingomonas sp.]|nr:energy transducer TonB [Sphingomonas sp.]
MIRLLITLAAITPASASTATEVPVQMVESRPEVRAPRLLSIPSPDRFYPHSAIAARLEGLTILRCRLPVDGILADCVVHRSSGVESLDAAALWLTNYARYSPMIESGVERETVVNLPIRWKLAE